jgi:NADH:ubiquinone oxidoreductase subunit C
MPTNYSRDEYSTLLNKQYTDLCKIEKSLFEKAKKDTLIDLSQVDILEEMKNQTLMLSGGMSERLKVLGGLQKVSTDENRFMLRKLKSDSLSSIINKEPTIVLDYLNNITKIQIDLLLKAQN